MGIYACIFVETSDGEAPLLRDSLPDGATISRAREWAPKGATHVVRQSWLYYGPVDRRGPWPTIAAALMALFAGENVETVWYFGDSKDSDEPFTRALLNEFNEHYMG